MLQMTTKVKQNEAELKINFSTRLFCTTLANKTKFIMLINLMADFERENLAALNFQSSDLAIFTSKTQTYPKLRESRDVCQPLL